MDKQRLIEAVLQAAVVGLIVGGVVIAGFDRVDAGGRNRWLQSSANRAAGLAISAANGRKIDEAHADVLKLCGARR